MVKFIIFSDKSGMFRFNLKSKNGAIILSSESYTTKSACLTGISSVRINARIPEHYIRKSSKNGQPYFILKARNGEVIGVSEIYTSSQALENGIQSVKLNANDAEIVDNTH